MTDIYSSSVRSMIMAAIKSKNTKPEVLIRSMLHRLGYRFRIHDNRLPGTPDIVLKKYRAVIEVNGCFWHGHNCHRFRLPQANREKWQKKIARNQERDKRNLRDLNDMGWRVLTIWECSMVGPQRLDKNELISQIELWLKGNIETAEISHIGLSTKDDEF